jgi:predicted nucleic acid-binding protein
VIYWDSSALVPLLVAEARSADCTRLLRADGVMIAWGLTPVEALSAIHRRHRERTLSHERWRRARRRLALFREVWNEVRDLDLVATRAERLLAIHAVRAADALQLAAALVACEERPAKLSFACLDAGLGAAAGREGFRVVP